MNPFARLAPLSGAWIAVLFFGGCELGRPAPPAPTPPPVTTALPATRKVTDYVEQTGRMSPVEAVEVRARVSGYLEKVAFQKIEDGDEPALTPGELKEGNDVTQGTVLFQIDPRPYQAVQAAAKAEVERTKALALRLDAEVRRADTLKASNNISAEEYDRIFSSRAEALASVKLAEAQQVTADLNFEFTSVKAPISGRLGRAMITKGNLVTADVTPLTTIVREDPIHVYFDLPEQTVKHYQDMIVEKKFTSAREAKLPVYLELPGETGFPHTGDLDFIDNQVLVSTGTLRLRARFDNPLRDSTVRRFTPGFFVRVRIPSTREFDAILISERAVTVDQGVKIVYVVDADDVAHRREVKLGSRQGGLIVVLDGLKADERIVVNGIQRVRDGAKVKPTSGDMTDGIRPTPSATGSATATGTPTGSASDSATPPVFTSTPTAPAPVSPAK